MSMLGKDSLTEDIERAQEMSRRRKKKQAKTRAARKRRAKGRKGR